MGKYLGSTLACFPQELDTASACARGTSGSLSPIVLILIEFQNQYLSEEDPQPDLLKTQPSVGDATFGPSAEGIPEDNESSEEARKVSKTRSSPCSLKRCGKRRRQGLRPTRRRPAEGPRGQMMRSSSWPLKMPPKESAYEA